MPRKHQKLPGTRQYGFVTRYTEAQLEEAIRLIKEQKLSQREASRAFKIPRQTLINKLTNKHTHSVGRPLVFSKDEESAFLDHCLFVSRMGIPIGLFDLRCIIKSYLDANKRTVSCFKNNMPGYDWGKSFLARHKTTLKECFAKNISQKRAAVSEKIITDFFVIYEKEVQGVPPSNIFNFDESGFHDIPSSKKLLFPRQLRHPEKVLNQTKTCYTTVFCGNAEGSLLPLYVIFNGKQKWAEWLFNAPPGTRLNVSDSGWMEQSIFEDWLEYSFLPSLKDENLSGKVVFLCDNLSAHISIKALQLCETNNISFICFPPNATHLLQPLDLTVFASLKTKYRSVLGDLRATPEGKKKLSLPKGTFVGLLRNALDLMKENVDDLLKKGFEKAGLYPLNCQRVVNDLPEYARNELNIIENVGETFKEYIENTRKSDLGIKQVNRVKLPVEPGKSVSREEVQKFYMEKEEDKKRKEADKNEKLKAKEEKKTRQLELRKSGPRTRGGMRRRGGGVLRTVTSTSHDSIYEEAAQDHDSVPTCSWETQVVPEEETLVFDETLLSSDISIDDYVIVTYMDQLYPGKVVGINLIPDAENTYMVRCMVRKGKQWIWPEKPDELSYDRNEIVKKIKKEDIKVINKRGMYQVKERLLYDEDEFETF